MMIVVTRDPTQPIRTVRVTQMAGGLAVIETQGAFTAGQYPEGTTATEVEQAIAKWMARDTRICPTRQEDQDNV